MVIMTLLIIVQAAKGGSFGRRCAKVKTVNDFDLERFLGRWYEIYRDHWAPYPYRECVTSKFYIRWDGKIGFKQSQTNHLHFNDNKQNLKRIVIDGYGTMNDKKIGQI